jgi:hypothetical protein
MTGDEKIVGYLSREDALAQPIVGAQTEFSAPIQRVVTPVNDDLNVVLITPI